MTGVRSMIVPALLIALLAPAARGQDTTGTAPRPAPAPQRPDTTAVTPPPAPAPQHAESTMTAPPHALTLQRAESTATATPTFPLDSVPAGRALLYLFNGSGRSLLGGKIGVKCDGRKIAELPRTSFSVVAVDPGKLKLQTGSGGGKLDLAAEAGHRYYILAAYWPEKSWATTPEDQPLFFQQIEEKRAWALIPRARRNEAPSK